MNAARAPLGLDPEIEPMLVAMAASGLFGDDFDPVAFRDQFEAMSPMMWDASGLTVARVEALTVPGADRAPLEARLYVPEGLGDDAAPLLLFFHGGGFASGSVRTADAHCRFLAREAGCLVLSSTYRLAPEHPFPAGVEDAFAVMRWTFANADRLGADPSRIAVGGDAPGGGFAAAAAIAARDEGLEPILQFLLSPATDFAGDYPDKQRNLAIGPVQPAALARLEAHYLADPMARTDWRCSPLRAPTLARVAPAFVLVGEYDFLAPEIDAYVTALRAAGVPTVYHRWPGATHNFFSMVDQLAIAGVAMRSAAAVLRRALHTAVRP